MPTISIKKTVCYTIINGITIKNNIGCLIYYSKPFNSLTPNPRRKPLQIGQY